MATASPFEAALRDVIDRLRLATTQLGAGQEAVELERQAVELALKMTRSERAAIALGSRSGGYERFWSVAADGAPLSDAAVVELISSAGFSSSPAGHPGAAIGEELKQGGRVVGVLVTGRTAVYDDTEKDALSIFAAQVSSALDAADLRRRKRELETALTELRRSLDRELDQAAEISKEMGVVERVERAQELAVEVLLAVSSHASSGHDLADFYGRLAKTVGELVDAQKVLFWRLKEPDQLVPDGGYGVSERFLARLEPTHCEPSGEDLASRVVFKDLVFRANRSEEPSEFAHVLDRLGVASAISVPWRAGNQRLGLLAAYNSTRRGGFSREDTWVLQKAGLAAGLVTQLWHTQEDLRKSLERLTKVDAARQLLLRNVTTVAEKERRRFVAELHDDALQKLTAAEMQATKLISAGAVDPAAYGAVTRLLQETEAALRRLVFEVHPPALDDPDGLVRSIEDRVGMLSGSGIECELELGLPDNLGHDARALLFRQVAEAIGNVERHSKATKVSVSLKTVDGGVLGVITDNGRGFSVAEKSSLPGHLGLQALKERALMAGGRYKIESAPGAGARIEFWIPLAP